MDAFDYAWRLLKMPLVPESVQHTGTSADGADEYTAQFLHPVTGEIYPMQGYAFDDDAGVFIHAPNQPPPDLTDGGTGYPVVTGDRTIDDSHNPWIAEASFMPKTEDRKLWTGSPYIEDRDPFGHHHDETEPPPYADTGYGGTGGKEPPVGMGTAMYDLAALMSDKHGAKIIPDTAQTVNAANMWAKHRDKGYWPAP